MKELFGFASDTIALLFVLLTFMLALTINTVIFGLTAAQMILTNGVTMYGALTVAYAGRAKAILTKAQPSEQPKGTLH